MRILLTVFFFLSLPLSLFSQTELFVGGDFGFRIYDNEGPFAYDGFVNERNRTSYTIVPTLGLKYGKHVLAGINLGYERINFAIPRGTHADHLSRRGLVIGPFFRFRFPLGQHWGLHSEINYKYSREDQVVTLENLIDYRNRLNRQNFYVAIGGDIRLNQKWLISLQTQVFRYQKKELKIIRDSADIITSQLGISEYTRYTFRTRLSFLYFISSKKELETPSIERKGQPKLTYLETFIAQSYSLNARDIGAGFGIKLKKNKIWSIGIARSKGGYSAKYESTPTFLGAYSSMRHHILLFSNTNMFIDYSFQLMSPRYEDEGFNLKESIFRLSTSAGLQYTFLNRITLRASLVGAYAQIDINESDTTGRFLRIWSSPKFFNLGLSVGI